MEIREIEPGEYGKLAELTLTAYRAVPGNAVSADYQEQLLDVESRAEGAVVLVAVDGPGPGGRVLGGVTFVPDASNPYAEFDDAAASGIRMLAVDPSAQNRGVGEALVRACLARARDGGRARVVLHSTPWMSQAHRLYARLGFERREDLDWHPVPDVELAGYVYELRG